MAAGAVIIIANPGEIVGPAVPQTDYAVAGNFERFDGLAAVNVPSGPTGQIVGAQHAPYVNGQPMQLGYAGVGGPSIGPGELDHPAGLDPESYVGGYQTGNGDFGQSPRPGQMGQPIGQVYTEGPIQGVVGTLGGQPYPVSPRIYKNVGGYTHSKWPTVQYRLGVGQIGPSELGAAQTVYQSEITSNPPVPGDLSMIIAGLA